MHFVDIHTHVLYGLDDGAKDVDESVEMLALAKRMGTRAIVASPHANGRYPFKPAIVEQRVAELRARADMAVHPGCDFHLQFDNIEDAIAHPAKYTIDHRSYLLVEFSDLGILHTAGDILARLLDAGMIPIITHPERNAHLRRSLDDIAGWVASGCYVQVTAGSFTGAFGKPARSAAAELVARGLVHVVASDAHDAVRRPPNLQAAYERLANDWGEETIRPLFVENPDAIVRGETIDYELPAQRIKRRAWYRFWT